MHLAPLKNLFIEISYLSRNYEKVAQLSGENFNVFEILNLRTSEVRTHSAFLAELLNPRGSHGQKDLFLQLFVKQFHITNFDTRSAFAEIERHTGTINEDYTEGGRIDILITDGRNRHIIIENKIYAGDQKNQLVRYHNFNPKGNLFYLTLFGYQPSEWSTNGKLDPEKYQVISYKQDIIEWLEQCKKEAVALPIIRETLAQYTNLLRSLTNQSTKEKMKDEIKALLLSHPDYLSAFEACSQAINSVVLETKVRFKHMFELLFTPVDIPLKNQGYLHINWGEDSDGIYFGYQYHIDGQNASGSEEGKALSAIMKRTDYPTRIYSNNNYIGWFFAEPIQPGQKFDHLDKMEIFKMNDNEAYMREFINKLILQENKFRQAFIINLGILQAT